MKKYLSIALTMAAGLAVCCLAPALWRLIGAFGVGAGCYALVEVLKLKRIEQEIERYEQPHKPELAPCEELILTGPEADVPHTIPFCDNPEPLTNVAA